MYSKGWDGGMFIFLLSSLVFGNKTRHPSTTVVRARAEHRSLRSSRNASTSSESSVRPHRARSVYIEIKVFPLFYVSASSYIQ